MTDVLTVGQSVVVLPLAEALTVGQSVVVLPLAEVLTTTQDTLEEAPGPTILSDQQWGTRAS